MALSGLRGETQRILERLTAHGVPHAIVGDLAVSARTEPRFTRDVDVAVAIISDGEAERLIRALQQAGYVVSALVEPSATERVATVRLIDSAPGDEGAIIDLLFASSGIEDEITATAEEIELFEGVLAPVATVPALIALKMLARDDTSRPQDRADLGALLAITTVEERADAGRLCALIEERGYDRGRDLSGQLAELERQLGVS